MWAGDPKSAIVDSHAAFRGSFHVEREGEYDLRLLATMPVLVSLDGEPLVDGPVRFPPDRPEYLLHPIYLRRGEHRLLVRGHYEGITTRIMQTMAPLVACEMDGLEITWEAATLGGYTARMRRINPQLGWIEWCDTRESQETWGAPHRKPFPWSSASNAAVAAPRLTHHALKAIASGPLADKFGYPKDDPSARFFLRDLECRELPKGGVWRRYDLGRVRLGRPRFTLDLPAGAVVEIAGCEAMERGRVHAWITLSDGQSCNLDHYVARGGEQEFMPVVPKGMRFLEIHVLAPPSQIRFLKEGFLERHYYPEAEGKFESDDSLLGRIWTAGVETFRGCTEDSLIDNPTRERGQWTGDVVTVGMDIASVAYHDLRPVRRALIQSSECARDDGLISGLCPGGGAYLSTYAIQWISACMHFLELTGDRALLNELYSAAERNLSAFQAHMTPDGLKDDLGWAFIDWGYVRNAGPSDMGLNLHYLLGLRDMVRWCEILDKPAAAYRERADQCEAIVRAWLQPRFAAWDQIGLQRTVLALRAGLMPKERAKDALAFVKRHYLSCFPNDPDAPRLSDPGAAQPRLITPYFSHYALAELWERGEGDFVLDQYRTCWGWALEDHRTTLVEVFDTRWSHCHQWSGCPTWQLSRYVLGLRPRFDLGEGVFEFTPTRTKLRRAHGRRPLPGGGMVDVAYARESAYGRWTIHTDRPIRLRTARGEKQVERSFTYEESP
jgi:hypothetical protein